MVLALLADAVRAAGAVHVTAIVPYFGYARQEQRAHRGDPRSAQVVSRLLGSVGIDHLVTLDLHAPALESAFPMPATLLMQKNSSESRLVPPTWLSSPDAGGIKRAAMPRLGRRWRCSEATSAT
jgi:ribose-phosphate pyrophosphokinase